MQEAGVQSLVGELRSHKVWGVAEKEYVSNERDPGSTSGSEKGMATHFSILAWRIPWTEEPGDLKSMGSQRVGHN